MARLFNLDAFIISTALLKAHPTMVATLSVKNITMGAPLHSTPKDERIHSVSQPADARTHQRRDRRWRPRRCPSLHVGNSETFVVKFNNQRG